MTSRMKPLWGFLFIVALSVTLGGCCSMKKTESPIQTESPTQTERPAQVVSKELVGTVVVLEGQPQRRKGGITIVGEGFEVWLVNEELLSDDVFGDDATGPLMRFSGTLDEDQGLPVFIQDDSDLAVQGIPVPAGTDLEKASHRFLLRDATVVESAK